MIRVVHLGKYYPPSPGGIEGHTQTLARAQAELGADVRVVVVNHASRDGRDATFDRFTRTQSTEEFDGKVRVIRVGRLANVAKLDVVPGLAATLNRILLDPPDIWHLHTPNVTMMLAIIANPRIRPLIITHHSDIIRQQLLKHLIRPLESVVYRRAAQILTDSAAYSQGSELLQKFLKKVTPIPLGINLTAFRDPNLAVLQHADRLKQKYGSPLWLSVGRLVYYKGLAIALEALRDVPGKLVIIGTGPMESQLKEKAEQLGVSQRVVWYGHASTDELVGAYHAATAFWFPSIARSEGFGLVQVEAMASGCPVINTAVPASGVAWVSPHEESGLTVPLGDAKAFAAAANRLVANPELRNQLAAGGKARAAAEFDWLLMGKRSLEAYHSVIYQEQKRCD